MIAKHSRPQTTAVAGYDLTFSPVKSVSTLWALAEPRSRRRSKRPTAPRSATRCAFIEQHALFSRTGANGVRQVNVQGLVAAAFTHRDSRAGDPDLHTHVAVANKVQTLDGRWLSIDGRILFKATVAASETYNTALEHHLRDSLGRPVRRTAGPGPAEAADTRNRRRRPRSDHPVVGPPPPSKPAAACLPPDFQTAHGRPPTPVESLQLAQQATLETRDAKHEPRSLAEQRQVWFAQAADVLGGQTPSTSWSRAAQAPLQRQAERSTRRGSARPPIRCWRRWKRRRSTWQIWHVRAEAQRQSGPPTCRRAISRPRRPARPRSN